MTITPEASTEHHDHIRGTLTRDIPDPKIPVREIQVRTDPAGKPLALRHEDGIWLVDPHTESQHWFARDS